jgi:hypothetical protein
MSRLLIELLATTISLAFIALKFNIGIEDF